MELRMELNYTVIYVQFIHINTLSAVNIVFHTFSSIFFIVVLWVWHRRRHHHRRRLIHGGSGWWFMVIIIMDVFST